MISKAKDRLQDSKTTFYSDGNDDYLYVLPEFFDDMDYGQLVKKRESGKVVGKPTFRM